MPERVGHFDCEGVYAVKRLQRQLTDATQRLAEVEVSNEMLRGCLSDAQATIERLGQDRQYHMNCINRLAKRVGALGETSETVIDKAEQQVARLRECVEYYAQTAIGARAVEALRETGRQP